MNQTKKLGDEKSQSFEEYVKEHGEEEAVPFDDVLRKLVNQKPHANSKSSDKRKK